MYICICVCMGMCVYVSSSAYCILSFISPNLPGPARAIGPASTRGAWLPNGGYLAPNGLNDPNGPTVGTSGWWLIENPRNFQRESKKCCATLYRYGVSSHGRIRTVVLFVWMLQFHSIPLSIGLDTWGEDIQGLVTVPFWVYWTSPYSSHYRPCTDFGWVMLGTSVMTHDI